MLYFQERKLLLFWLNVFFIRGSTHLTGKFKAIRASLLTPNGACWHSFYSFQLACLVNLN